MIPVARMQENDGRNDDLGAWTSEHNMRLEATKIVLPVYPEDALSKGAEGIVVVRVGADAGGEVAKVKTPPDINPLFRKEAVVAARQWRFKPHHLLRPGKYLVSRLTFRFFIKDGKGEVELYSPPWDSAEGERLRGAGERADAEWRRWEDAAEEK